MRVNHLNHLNNRNKSDNFETVVKRNNCSTIENSYNWQSRVNTNPAHIEIKRDIKLSPLYGIGLDITRPQPYTIGLMKNRLPPKPKVVPRYCPIGIVPAIIRPNMAIVWEYDNMTHHLPNRVKTNDLVNRGLPRI